MSHPKKCVTCGAPVAGKFCPQCGEKRIEPHDLTLRHFSAHAIEAFTHADGKIFRTLRSLVFRPGELTADYLAGRRRPYIGPLQLFLICNVLYFLLLPFIHWDSLSSTLSTNMELSFFRELATAMVREKLAASGMALETYRIVFDHAAVLHGKSLVILLVPLYMLPLALLYDRRDRPLLTHLVFALHFCAFFLLALMTSLELMNLAIALVTAAHHHLNYQARDLGSALPLLVLSVYYLQRGARRAYAATGWTTVIRTAVLVGLLVPILTAYRFVLFLITFWAT